MLAPLTLVQLAREVGDKLLDEFAPQLPQAAQLIKHQRRKAALRKPEARFEHTQHLLRAQSRAFLLFDAIFEAVDFVLQGRVSFFELGPIAEQREYPPVLGVLGVKPHVELQAPKLSQCLHQKCGRHRPGLKGAKRSSSPDRSDDRAPRNIPATYLTSGCAPSADPVHAPRGCAAL